MCRRSLENLSVHLSFSSSTHVLFVLYIFQSGCICLLLIYFFKECYFHNMEIVLSCLKHVNSDLYQFIPRSMLQVGCLKLFNRDSARASLFLRGATPSSLSTSVLVSAEYNLLLAFLNLLSLDLLTFLVLNLGIL